VKPALSGAEGASPKRNSRFRQLSIGLKFQPASSNWKPVHSSKSSRLGQRNVALTFFRAALTITGVKRKFHVTLIEHDEGVSVSCPELPGCHSQGATVKEALQNIEDAIREYLEVYGEPNTRCEIREMEVVTA